MHYRGFTEFRVSDEFRIRVAVQRVEKSKVLVEETLDIARDFRSHYMNISRGYNKHSHYMCHVTHVT